MAGAPTLAHMVSADAQAFREFVGSVLQTGSLLLRHGDAANRPFGQTSARWRVLLRVSQGEDSVPEIARNTGYSRQATQRLADALVADGLARYRPSDIDRRRQHVELTDVGRLTLERLETHYEVWSSRLVAEIGLDDLQQLTETLDRVREVVQRDIPPQPDAPTRTGRAWPS